MAVQPVASYMSCLAYYNSIENRDRKRHICFVPFLCGSFTESEVSIYFHPEKYVGLFANTLSSDSRRA